MSYNTHSPLISVITVTYNAASLAEKTLTSIMSQTFSDCEHIIIDGGSTDGTTDIIRRYASDTEHGCRITFWSSEPDSGIYDAMNKGIRASSGEWIIFMNAGDTFYDNDTLTHISNILTDRDDVIYGNAYTTDGRVYCNIRITENRLIRGKMICHQSIFARKKTFDDNMFDTSYRLIADKIWLCKVLRRYSIRKVSIPVCCYDTTGLSTVNADKIDAENKRFLHDFYGFRWNVISLIQKIKHSLKMAFIGIICRKKKP